MSSEFPRKGRLKQLYQQDSKVRLKKLVCFWCGDIYKDPQRLYCGHTLCNSCLQDELESARQLKMTMRCSMCRAVVDTDQIGEDMIAKAMVDQIRVKCSTKKCTWQGLNKDFESHYNHECLNGERTCEARYEYTYLFDKGCRYYSSKAEFAKKLNDEQEIKEERPNMMHPMVRTSMREKIEKEWEAQMRFKEEELMRKTKRLRRTFG